MSFSSLRRALPTRAVIVASSVLAMGGTLAVVSSASAASIPTGASTDAAYSGTGTPSSLYSIYNGVAPGLYSAAQALQTDVGDTNATVDSATSESALTTSNVPQIVADFTGATFDGVAPSSTTYAAELAVGDPDYTTQAAELPSAGTGFDEIDPALNLALADPAAFPGGLFSLDGDLAVSSAATVGSVANPNALSITLGTTSAATGGILVPSAFSVTIPKDYGINVGLAGKEIPLADIANPTASSAGAIGTVTLKTPALVYEGLGTATTLTGKIYAVDAVNGDPTKVELEIYFDLGGLPVYDVSSQLSSLTFPLTLSWGEFSFAGTSEPLPLSSMTLAFPAATSAVEAQSCKSLGTVTASAIDNLQPLAAEFGDTTDGSSTATVPAVATATKVTDKCVVATKLTLTKSSGSGVKTGKAKFGFTLADNKDFSSFTVTVPKGFSYSKFTKSDLKVSGASVKSVKAKGTKLTVTLKKAVKKVTVKVNKGIKETKAAKKDKTVTLKVGASSKSVSVKIKA